MKARIATALVGLGLVAAGLRDAPSGLEPTRIDALAAASEMPASDAAKWIRLWVARPEPADAFLDRHQLTGAHKVCRRRCEGPNEDCSSRAPVQGDLWVAFGTPPPSKPPDDCASATSPRRPSLEAGAR
jgi:hypothetical protein